MRVNKIIRCQLIIAFLQHVRTLVHTLIGRFVICMMSRPCAARYIREMISAIDVVKMHRDLYDVTQHILQATEIDALARLQLQQRVANPIPRS